MDRPGCGEIRGTGYNLKDDVYWSIGEGSDRMNSEHAVF